MPNEIRSYSELQQQIHEDLRIQHPDCPTCDSYEARLAVLLGLTQRSKVMLPAPFLGHADDYRD